MAWHERVVRFRINTHSIRVALRTARLLEAVMGGRFDIAISTKNFILLDCDDKSAIELFTEFCRGLCREYAARGFMYETPHGFHFVLLKFMSFPRWRTFYRWLLRMMDEEPELEDIIDRAHVEACLRRGYATLRLVQLRRYLMIDETGEVIFYE